MPSTLKGIKVDIADSVIYRTATTFGIAIISNITNNGRIRVNGFLFDTNGSGLGKGSKVCIEPLKLNQARELKHKADICRDDIQQYLKAAQEHLSIASIALTKLSERITQQ